MKKIILFTSLFSSVIFAHTLTVSVSNVQNSRGAILIGLFNSSSNFTKMDAIYKRGIISSFDAKNLTYTFSDLPNASYAISIFHDENSNEKLDKNFFGLPKEGYGFSNNIRPTFRPATFEESKFELNSDKNITIKMGY